MNALRLLFGLSILLSGCIAIDPQEVYPDTDNTIGFFETRLFQTRNPTYMHVINFVVQSLKEYHVSLEVGYQTINSSLARVVSGKYADLILRYQEKLNGLETTPGVASNKLDAPGIHLAFGNYMSNCVGDSYKCRKVLVASYATLIASQTDVERRKGRLMLKDVLLRFRNPDHHSIWKGIFLCFYLRGLRRFINTGLINQAKFDQFVEEILSRQRVDLPIERYIRNSRFMRSTDPRTMAPGAEYVESPIIYHTMFIEELIWCSELIQVVTGEPGDLAVALLNWILEVSKRAENVLGIVTRELNEFIGKACTRQLNRWPRSSG